jgi:hypothetical protein
MQRTGAFLKYCEPQGRPVRHHGLVVHSVGPGAMFVKARQWAWMCRPSVCEPGQAYTEWPQRHLSTP